MHLTNGISSTILVEKGYILDMSKDESSIMGLVNMLFVIP
jgi:hypothetical protein